MHEALSQMLKRLRLSGLAASLEVRLQEAAAAKLNHLDFLELILQDEVMVREERSFNRHVNLASFRERRSLKEFDWNFNPAIRQQRMYKLGTGRLIRECKDVLLYGPPGTGKSHLVQAIENAVIKSGFTVFYPSVFDVVRDFLHDEAFEGHDNVLNGYLKPDLLITDDMGMKQLPKRSGEYLFEVIMRRYETRSTMMTSNRPLEDRGKLIGDVPSATAILDRFLHHAELITIQGKSYGLKDRVQIPKVTKALTGQQAENKKAKGANSKDKAPKDN